MRAKAVLCLLGIMFVWMVIPASVALSQDSLSCRVLKDYGDGSYLVQIGDRTLLAISEEMEKSVLKLRRDLLDAQKEGALKDSLLASYDQATLWYDTTLSRQKEYIAELESVLEGYKKLLKDYKKLREPWFTFEGGLGATGDDREPAVLMGMGIRRLRIWGFLQESNSGAFVGTTFPLF